MRREFSAPVPQGPEIGRSIESSGSARQPVAPCAANVSTLASCLFCDASSAITLLVLMRSLARMVALFTPLVVPDVPLRRGRVTGSLPAVAAASRVRAGRSVDAEADARAVTDSPGQ